jgi:DNA-binding beta-propeller fold protein YncE
LIGGLLAVALLLRWPDVAAPQARLGEVAAPRPPSLQGSILMASSLPEQDRQFLRPVDPETGETVAGYAPLAFAGPTYWPAFTADGQVLAAVSTLTRSCGAGCERREGLLHLVSLASWEQVTMTLPFDGYVGAMAFNPAGTRLALAVQEWRGNSLVVVDVVGLQVAAQLAVKGEPRLLRYRPDGETLAVYLASGNTREPVRAMLLTAELQVQWQTVLPEVVDAMIHPERISESELPTVWLPGAALTPDAGTLYLVHADAARLTMVDFGAQSLRTVAIQPRQSWLEWLLVLTAGRAEAKVLAGTSKHAALSADGRWLYVTGMRYNPGQDVQGNITVDTESLGLQVIDTTSGAEVARDATEASHLGVSGDGRFLLLYRWEAEQPWTEVRDANSFGLLAEVEGYHLLQGCQLDGRELLFATTPTEHETRFTLLDPHSFQPVRDWIVGGHGEWLLNQDCRGVAVEAAVSQAPRVAPTAVAPATTMAQLPTTATPAASHAVAAGPALLPTASAAEREAANAPRLYLTAFDLPNISVIDSRSGHTLHTVPVEGQFPGVAVSPDGARLYVVDGPGAGRLRVLDTATWEVVHEQPVAERALRLSGNPVALTGDGRWLLVERYSYARRESWVSIFDTHTLQFLADQQWRLGACPHPMQVTGRAGHPLLYAVCDDTMVALDAETLAPLWRVGLPQGTGRHMTITFDGRFLYGLLPQVTLRYYQQGNEEVHGRVEATELQLLVWETDREAARLLRQVRLNDVVAVSPATIGRGDRGYLALSPDGQHLYVVWEDRLWRLATVLLQAELGATGQAGLVTGEVRLPAPADGLVLSPGGAELYVVPATSGDLVARGHGLWVGATKRFALARHIADWPRELALPMVLVGPAAAKR